ncbi:MAG: metal-dependent hydrolase [Rubrivivax sp.]
MTELTVRRLLVDLDTPWPRHWVGGDAFRSAWLNALSYSFPAGEQLFIDAVRLGLAQLDPAARERFAPEVQGFIGQEATHRRVHQRFNARLDALGYHNAWEQRIRHRVATQLEGLDARAWVAVTAATEHFTAILAEYLLTEPWALDGAEPRLRDLWLWHSSEESEHRSTAFDLYRALGGSEKWRRRVYVTVSLHFVSDLARQMTSNLWRDGHLWRPATWVGGARLVFGRRGIVRRLLKPWWRYFGTGFHPSQGDAVPGARWLAAHADLAPPVAAP